MFYCERCRIHHGWPYALTSDFGLIPGQCDVCSSEVCDVKGCREPAITARIICDTHAYPTEQKKSSRRRAIEAQKSAKVSGNTDEEGMT